MNHRIMELKSIYRIWNRLSHVQDGRLNPDAEFYLVRNVGLRQTLYDAFDRSISDPHWLP